MHASPVCSVVGGLSTLLVFAALATCSPPNLAGLPLGSRIPRPALPPSDFDYNAYLAKVKTYRLPYSVFPSSYNLVLIPYLEDSKFEGNVTIMAQVLTETNVILLHSHRLDILSVTVSQRSQLVESSYTLLPVPQMLNITTQKALPAETNVYLTIKFKGVLNDDLVGFYRSSYPSVNGTKWLATTHFFPMFARMVFPCFDEPLFRAQFTLSMARYEHQRVLSNMPLRETSFPIKSLNGRVMDEFWATPSMPVHAFAFVVSEFYFLANDVEKYWVWARQDVVNDGQEALHDAETLLEAFEVYTRVRYELPKMALAAIPDFQADAMENWGLITTREPFLLANRKLASAANLEKIATTMANKLARQWFGNYVTMMWWDYWWLHEGLATYLQYIVTNSKKSHMRLKKKFILEVTHYALSIDGISNHRQINALVNSPEEIMEMFDDMNHSKYKVAAVFHMIANFLGSTTFSRALEIYLKLKNEDGGVATPEDVYSVLEFVRLLYRIEMPSGLNLFVMMDQFFHQIGYPLLTVTRHTGSEAIDITIKQSPYRSPRSQKEIPDQVWTIPFSCARRKMYHMDNFQVEFWSHNKEPITLNNIVDEDEWYICNVQQTGYFRVNYDKENWNLLVDQLNTAPEEIHHINRAQILDDSYTFALDEKLPFLTLLNIFCYLKWERHVIPWHTGLQKLRDLYTRYELTPLAADLKTFTREAITDFYDIIGFNLTADDSHAAGVFRGALTMVACHLQVSDCVSQATFIYDNKTNDLSRIPADIKETVLCVAVRTDSTKTTWDHVWNFYRKTNVASEKDTILLALGCTQNEELLKKYLFKLIDDRDVDIRKHNRGLVYESILRYHQGVISALKFIKEILPNMNKYQKAPEIVSSLLKSMRSVVKSKEHERLLDESIMEAGKVNQKSYADVTAALKVAKKAARENWEEYEKRVAELSRAINKYYKRPEPVKTKTSAACNLIPNSLVFSLSLSLITLLYSKSN